VTGEGLAAELVSAAPALLVAVPFAGALLVFLSGRAAATPLGVATSVLTASLALVAAWGAVDGTTLGYAVGGWQAPLGIELRADGFAVLMLVATAAVGLTVSGHAVPYFAGGDGRPWPSRISFWALWLALWASLNALLVAADSFNAYICLELVTLAAVALVTLTGGQLALASALRYLLAAFVGALMFLGGVALAYSLVGELSLSALARLPEGPATAATIALLTVGLSVKAALFPLHFWLPGAHSRAPVPASAVLSGLVVAAALYLLLRLWFELLPAHATGTWAPLLGAVAVAAMVMGSYRAVRARRLKLLLAHSTVAQVGLIVVALPIGLAVSGLAAEPAHEARHGAALLLVSHGLAKAALFLGAGALMHAVGHDQLGRLGGTGRRLPLVLVAMAIASASLAGLPLTGGDAGKHLLADAATAGGQWWWWLALQLSTLLTLAYVGIILWRTLAPEPQPGLDGWRPVPRLMQLTPLALALGALAVGLTEAHWRSLMDVGLMPLAGAGP
jgi:multicomponent Na+:H+ antiporter subunit D